MEIIGLTFCFFLGKSCYSYTAPKFLMASLERQFFGAPRVQDFLLGTVIICRDVTKIQCIDKIAIIFTKRMPLSTFNSEELYSVFVL